MANVYVSVLGKTNYSACTYVLPDGTEVPNVRFVQEATIRHACRDWTPKDRIRIFTTPEAFENNWKDRVLEDPKSGEQRKLEGLESRLNQIGTAASIKHVDIVSGETEEEIWQIFQILFDNLNPDDHVVFDITHGFRSLPMLAMVILHYAGVIKDVRLAGIYYGAFEAKKGDKAPVFDLTAIQSLLDWSVAVDLFLRTGNAALASQLAAQQARSILKDTKGKDEGAQAVRKVAGALETFSRDMATCRGLSITKDIEDLKNAINRCTDPAVRPSFIPAFLPLLERIKTRLEDFDSDEVLDGIRAARWCLDHNLVQQGYTILREFLVNYVAYNLGVQDPVSRVHRQATERVVGLDAGLLSDFRKQRGKDRQEPDEIPLLFYFGEYPEIPNLFNKIADDRNDLNHAGMRTEPKPSESFFKSLPKLIDEFEQIIASR